MRPNRPGIAKQRIPVTKILAFCCILLGSISIYLLYHVIDLSVALDDAGSQHRLTLQEVDALRDFAFDLAKDKSREDIRNRVLSRFGKKYLVDEDPDGTIHLQDISFKFNGNQLTAIVAMTDSLRASRQTR
jgi:hypothetical protein